MEQNAGTKQLSQGANRAETHIHGIYESASSIARRVLESMQALAGTTSCKGVQISELEKWAKENKFWIEAPVWRKVRRGCNPRSISSIFLESAVGAI